MFDEDHEAEVARLAQMDEAGMLGELLAVLHRDGGHYVEEHGLPRAVADAMRNFWYWQETPSGGDAS